MPTVEENFQKLITAVKEGKVEDVEALFKVAEFRGLFLDTYIKKSDIELERGVPTLTPAPILISNLETGTVLHLAAFHNRGEIIQWLLSKGVNVSEKNDAGQTPLHIAARRGNLGAAKILVEEGKAELNEQDNLGNSSMHLALSSGQTAFYKWLFKKQADSHIKNLANKSPDQVSDTSETINFVVNFLLKKVSKLKQQLEVINTGDLSQSYINNGKLYKEFQETLGVVEVLRKDLEENEVTLQETLSASEASKNELQKEISCLQASLETSEANKEEMQKQISCLKASLETSEASKNELQKEISCLQAFLETSEANKEEMHKEIIRLKVVLDAMPNKEELQKEMAQLCNEMAQLQTTLNAVPNKEEVQKETKQLQNTMLSKKAELQSGIGKLQKAILSMEEKLQKEIAQFQTTLNARPSKEELQNEKDKNIRFQKNNEKLATKLSSDSRWAFFKSVIVSVIILLPLELMFILRSYEVQTSSDKGRQSKLDIHSADVFVLEQLMWALVVLFIVNKYDDKKRVAVIQEFLEEGGKIAEQRDLKSSDQENAGSAPKL